MTDRRRILLELWNRGELAPGELIVGFRHAGSRIARTAQEFRLLEEDLSKNQRVLFRSIAEFTRYARRVARIQHSNRFASSLLEALEAEDSRADSSERPADAALSSWQGGSLDPLRRFEEGSDISLEEVAETIAQVDQNIARVWVLHSFGGLTLEEIARRSMQPLSEVREDWEIAKNWANENREYLESKRLHTQIAIFDPVDIGLLQAIRQHPELLRTLDWRVFEKLLGGLLERLGFEIELQRGTKDGGIDIFAMKRSEVLGPHRYIIQAKRWSHRVGVAPVRELIFLHGHYKTSKACLATTASFTRGAWKIAEDYRWQLELRDFQGLQEWVELATRSPIDTVARRGI